jgi:two-component system response regulator
VEVEAIRSAEVQRLLDDNAVEKVQVSAMLGVTDRPLELLSLQFAGRPAEEEQVLPLVGRDDAVDGLAQPLRQQEPVEGLAADEIAVAPIADLLFGQGDLSGSRPDLVLLDVNLPKRSGLDVLASLRQHDSFNMLPVVILTASARHEDVIASYRLGANSYIQKPIIFERRTRTLEVLSEYWFEVATLPPPA